MAMRNNVPCDLNTISSKSSREIFLTISKTANHIMSKVSKHITKSTQIPRFLTAVYRCSKIRKKHKDKNNAKMKQNDVLYYQNFRCTIMKEHNMETCFIN
jgi:hypothetical protein